MDQLICASLSHTHYWYQEGMLEALVCFIFCVPEMVDFFIFISEPIDSGVRRMYGQHFRDI